MIKEESMELRQLRYFLTVAQELHFTRAAARLGIVQPGLTYQIQLLERDLGAHLFERVKRRVQLTDVGKAFVTEAQNILDQAEHARRVVQRVERGETGSLTVGYVPVAAYDIIPNVLFKYRKRYPGVNLTLVHTTPPDQVQQL